MSTITSHVDKLPGHAENRRGGGGLMQLVAYGAPDVYLTCSSDAPMSCRNSFAGRSSANRPPEYAFLDTPKGHPSADDLRSASGTLSMLAHVPDAQAPSRTDVTQPFHVRSEPDTACWDARKYTPIFA